MDKQEIGAVAYGLGILFGMAVMLVVGALVVGLAIRVLWWAAGIPL